MALDIIKVFHQGSTQLKLEILQNSKNMKHMFKVLKVQAYQENVYERGPGKIRHSQELTIFFFLHLSPEDSAGYTVCSEVWREPQDKVGILKVLGLLRASPYIFSSANKE